MSEHKDRYSHICRAWDGVRWVSFIETSFEEAKDEARKLMDLSARTECGEDVVPFLLIEVAGTDARGIIACQWVGTPSGYTRVTGR